MSDDATLPVTSQDPCPCGHASLADAGCVKGYPFSTCIRCRFTFTAAAEGGAARAEDDDERYPDEGWALSASFLDPALERLPEGTLKILDFGAGESKIPGLLRQQGHWTVAVDLRQPRRPHPDRPTGNILHLPLRPGQFDLVYSFQVFEHLPRPAAILERLIQLTRDRGLVLIHTDMEMPERDSAGFSNWWYVMPPRHCSYYRNQTFEVFFEGRPEEVVWKDEKRVLVRVHKS